MSGLKFSGKTLLIVGASCEIGIECTKQALELGLSLILALRDPSKLPQSYKEREEVQIVPFDLSRPQDFSAIPWKKIDYLFDLAHPVLEGLLASSNEEEVATYFTQSITAKASLIKHAIRGMLKRPFGRMVYLSTTAASRTNPGQGFYAAAKIASEKLYETAGIEMGSKRITTAILRAGYVNSGRGAQFAHEGKIKTTPPTGKPLTPQEVAGTLLFLLSDTALQINATTLTQDGGMSSCK